MTLEMTSGPNISANIYSAKRKKLVIFINGLFRCPKPMFRGGNLYHQEVTYVWTILVGEIIQTIAEKNVCVKSENCQ